MVSWVIMMVSSRSTTAKRRSAMSICPAFPAALIPVLNMTVDPHSPEAADDHYGLNPFPRPLM